MSQLLRRRCHVTLTLTLTLSDPKTIYNVMQHHCLHCCVWLPVKHTHGAHWHEAPPPSATSHIRPSPPAVLRQTHIFTSGVIFSHGMDIHMGSQMDFTSQETQVCEISCTKRTYNYILCTYVYIRYYQWCHFLLNLHIYKFLDSIAVSLFMNIRE